MGDRLTDAITFAVLGLVGVRLASGLISSRTGPGRSLVAEILRGLRWRHVWPVPFVVAGVLLAAVPLTTVPLLRWGWWSTLGGEGNPVFGTSTSTAGSAWEWAIPMLFICLLVPALPLFAHAEERWFRTGAERWSPRRRALKVLQFGMIHAVIGIPIGAALALSVGGAWFMSVYLGAWRRTHDRDVATLESTRAHTAYNGLLVGLVAVLLVVEAAG